MQSINSLSLSPTPLPTGAHTRCSAQWTWVFLVILIFCCCCKVWESESELNVPVIISPFSLKEINPLEVLSEIDWELMRFALIQYFPSKNGHHTPLIH